MWAFDCIARVVSYLWKKIWQCALRLGMRSKSERPLTPNTSPSKWEETRWDLSLRTEWHRSCGAHLRAHYLLYLQCSVWMLTCSTDYKWSALREPLNMHFSASPPTKPHGARARPRQLETARSIRLALFCYVLFCCLHSFCAYCISSDNREGTFCPLFLLSLLLCEVSECAASNRNYSAIDSPDLPTAKWFRVERLQTTVAWLAGNEFAGGFANNWTSTDLNLVKKASHLKGVTLFVWVLERHPI